MSQIYQAVVEGSTVTIRFPYNPDIISRVKTLPQRRWLPTQRVWTAPAIPKVIEQLVDWGFDVIGAQLTQFEKSESGPIEGDPWKDVIVKPINGARPYQVDCLKFLNWRKGRGIIGDDTGIGKTVEALLFLREQIERLPAIIVVTSTTKFQWLREWIKWLGPEYPVDVLSGQTPWMLQPERSVIINWDILSHWHECLLELPFKTVIADECQKAGNTKSKRTKALMKLGKKFWNFLPMSGTPVRTRPGQFYPVLSLVEPTLFTSEWKFKMRYCNMVNNGYGWRELRGGRNLDELHEIVKRCMIRRKKMDVLKDLPPKSRIIVPLEIDEKSNAEYQEAYEETIGNLSENQMANRAMVDKLKWSAFGAKREAALNWIRDFLESGKKLTIFAYHLSVLDALHDEFGSSCIRIDGNITGAKREAAKTKFIEDENIQLMIAQIETMGVGVDGLQKVCDSCVFVEFGWTPTDHTQAEDRFWRSEQTSSVDCYYLIAQGTVDEELMGLLDQTTKAVDQIIDGKAADDADLLKGLLKIWREKNA